MPSTAELWLPLMHPPQSPLLHPLYCVHRQTRSIKNASVKWRKSSNFSSRSRGGRYYICPPRRSRRSWDTQMMAGVEKLSESVLLVPSLAQPPREEGTTNVSHTSASTSASHDDGEEKPRCVRVAQGNASFSLPPLSPSSSYTALPICYTQTHLASFFVGEATAPLHSPPPAAAAVAVCGGSIESMGYRDLFSPPPPASLLISFSLSAPPAHAGLHPRRLLIPA